MEGRGERGEGRGKREERRGMARATERFANVVASIGEVRNCRQKQSGVKIARSHKVGICCWFVLLPRSVKCVTVVKLPPKF